MIDIPFPNTTPEAVIAMGNWLEDNISNPPVHEQQCWMLGQSASGQYGIRFYDGYEYYATMFALKFSLLPKATDV